MKTKILYAVCVPEGRARDESFALWRVLHVYPTKKAARAAVATPEACRIFPVPEGTRPGTLIGDP